MFDPHNPHPPMHHGMARIMDGSAAPFSSGLNISGPGTPMGGLPTTGAGLANLLRSLMSGGYGGIERHPLPPIGVGPVPPLPIGPPLAGTWRGTMPHPPQPPVRPPYEGPPVTGYERALMGG